MNTSSEMSSSPESSFYICFQFYNNTEAKTDFKMFPVGYIICILFNFPINSYVIWLIVTGTGNGLAAEFFTLNLSVYEILLCVYMLLVYLAFDFPIPWMLLAFSEGVLVMDRPVFQCLICVERYLAVVHPVIFLKFKPLRYRLMCSAVAWIVTFASGGLNVVVLLLVFKLSFIFWIVLFIILVFIQLYCCLAVLRALKQSGPGERGREREEENHMKRRAFYLILITTVIMVTIYVVYIIFQVVLTSVSVFTLMFVCQFCYSFVGLIKPAFFLHRVGKLNFFCIKAAIFN